MSVLFGASVSQIGDKRVNLGHDVLMFQFFVALRGDDPILGKLSGGYLSSCRKIEKFVEERAYFLFTVDPTSLYHD